MDLNEGIRLLRGKSKIVLPLKKKEEPAPAAEVAAAPAAGAAITAPVTTTCTVQEGDRTRTFKITVEPPAGAAAAEQAPAPKAAGGGIPVHSPFKGKVELVEVKVRVGDSVSEGQVVAAVEAMKAKHDVRAPADGKVASIDAELGDDIVAGQPIMTLAP